MTLAYWCILVAALLPYVFTGIAKSAGGYDNRAPRSWLAQREGVHARAHAAQLNGYETFPAFAAAVIVAHVTGGAGQGTIDALAVAYVLLRLAYGAAYVTDRPSARSLLWTAAQGCMIGLFVAAA